ncbi:uncharacterized protein V1513DRAFT_448272 [Lipomyces chichibuensis]|uniref:uncharacterized protein n=1 Tax=Lipomyces chichibuensis TaxID=1546026 RepID=UPI003343A40A
MLSLSIREAARIYSASRATLARRQRGQRSQCNIVANSRKLTDLKESTIINIIQYFLDLDLDLVIRSLTLR